MCKNARVPRGGGRSGEGTGGGEARALEIDGEKRARAGRAGRYHDEERLEPWMGAAAGGSGPWGGVRSCWWTARALE